MRNRVLKALAALSLSVCVLAGGAVAGMAEGASGDKPACEHVWTSTTTYKTECVETAFQHKLPDGSTETIKLCTECGKEDGTARLTKVNGAFANYSNLQVYTGALKNGEQVMTVAFYYPTTTVKVFCEKCQKVKSETTTPARYMTEPVNASIELPAATVAGYTLMQVNADGTESPVAVSRSENGQKVFFQLDLTSGARLLHLIPNA